MKTTKQNLATEPAIQDREAPAAAASPSANWTSRILWILGIAAVIAGVRLLPTGEWIEAVNNWVKSLGVWGPIAYGGFYILAALAFIPGSAITIGAGALFGLGTGTVVVSLASTTSAAIALSLIHI